MNKELKRWVIIAMLLAMCVVISYLESLIPVFIPGVKLGLANVIILIMLYEFKMHEAFCVDVLRIFIVSFIRASFLTPTFFMSLSGGILSYVIMLIFSRIKIFSPVGVSILGSIFHCVGQILVAIILVSQQAVVMYLPFILLLSLATGVLSGLVTSTYLKRSITAKFIE